MTLEEYLEKLEAAKQQIKRFTLNDYSDKGHQMFRWILVEGQNLIGNEVENYGTPLWNVNYTQENQFADIRKQTGNKKKDSALSDFIRHFEQDLDLVIRQVEGKINRH